MDCNYRHNDFQQNVVSMVFKLQITIPFQAMWLLIYKNYSQKFSKISPSLILGLTGQSFRWRPKCTHMCLYLCDSQSLLSMVFNKELQVVMMWCCYRLNCASQADMLKS